MSKNKSKPKQTLIPHELIEYKIILIRGKRVMIDRDLAKLYRVETKTLNQAVKRNLQRFPEDFMFQMTKEELAHWKSQFVTSNQIKMGLRRQPYVFTEQGVAMLSSVLNSAQAIQVNIEIIRIFTKLRQMLTTHKDLKQKIESIEKKYNHQFRVIFETIKRLIDPPIEPKEPIGFHANKNILRTKKNKKNKKQ